MSVYTGLFTSEAVSAGHPDKLCDRISDAILDEFLKRDPEARVACETLATDQRIIVSGEFRTKDQAQFDAVKTRRPLRVTTVPRWTWTPPPVRSNSWSTVKALKSRQRSIKAVPFSALATKD